MVVVVVVVVVVGGCEHVCQGDQLCGRRPAAWDDHGRSTLQLLCVPAP